MNPSSGRDGILYSLAIDIYTRNKRKKTFACCVVLNTFSKGKGWDKLKLRFSWRYYGKSVGTILWRLFWAQRRAVLLESVEKAMLAFPLCYRVLLSACPGLLKANTHSLCFPSQSTHRNTGTKPKEICHVKDPPTGKFSVTEWTPLICLQKEGWERDCQETMVNVPACLPHSCRTLTFFFLGFGWFCVFWIAY